MSSALKPLTTSSQNSSTSNQSNKSMHPQGAAPAAYGQPSHMPQSLVNIHPNTNVAHNHPSSQQNHYSLNVPNAPGHYINQNIGQIPASNHPVANPSASAAGQMYSSSKNIPYAGGYQPNLGHPPNQNAVPPVTQSLPATNQPPPQQNSNSSLQSSENPADKPQSNGTPEVKSSPKIETQDNHISTVREKTPQPIPAQVPQVPQVSEKPPDKPKPVPIQEQKLPEPAKAPDTPESNAPTPPTSNSESGASSPAAQPESTASTAAEPDKTETVEKDQSSETRKTVSQPQVESANSENSNDSENEKETETAEASDNEDKISSTQSGEKQKPRDQSPPKKESSLSKPAATQRAPTRKAKPVKPEESLKTSKDIKTPTQKSPSTGKAKRQRTRTQPYQSPLPELEIITKITLSTPRNRSNDDKLIVFYKNEFLAVRNAEGSFYLCQAVQNIYKTSSKIKIRWLSQDKSDKLGEIYTPDFYDLTDFDCILTNLSLSRVDKGKYKLPPAEKERTESILNRSLAVEKGEVTSPSLTEEHPDGLDLSLYKAEDQLQKRRGAKRKAGRKPSRSPPKKETPTKKSPETPKARKVEPKSVKKAPLAAKKVIVGTKKAAPVPEPSKKVSTSTSRSGRGKRKSDIKSSPVVDQKKAKVLAKIGRKTAVSVPKPQSTTKNTKAAKANLASTSKKPATKPTITTAAKAPPPTRNSRRSARK